ncbi:MAG: IncP-type conjugal transfer protein TraG [Hyphomonadaceae bacterium]
MGSGRIFWGQIVAVLGALFLSAIAATQWVADALGHQAALGPPDAVLLDHRLYAPWKFLEWWFKFDAYARGVFETGALIFLCGVLLSILSAFAFSLWRSREDKKASTYGTARWANARDIRRLGLNAGDGVILGEAHGHILRHDGDEHVLVVAPTNTGKSVGVSLPTGLTWRGSYFTLDLKGENWTITSGLRRSFGPVYRFAPTREDTHRYNPLTAIRRGDSEVRDAQVLADMLVDPEGALRERSHWQLRAFELLVAAMLWTLYAEREKSLARVGEILADPARPVLDLFADMLNRPIRDGAPHPIVAAGARQMLDMAEGERSGVVSTALGCLALYRDPVLARATSASDFAIEDLVAGAQPVSLYLIVPPEEMSRLKALLRLVINQLLKRLTEIAAREPDGRRVLLLLDEFPQLGRLDFFEHALAYIRGYRLKACLVAQSLNQIAQAYGEHASILDNAHVRVAFACNDERTARRISDMLGVTTETRAQMNYAGSRMAPWLGHTMVSRQEVGRPLLTPGEVMQLPPDEAVILTGGAPPIRARKIRYFAMPVFKARVRPPFASPRPGARGLPTSWDGLAVPPAIPHAPLQTVQGASASPPSPAHARAATSTQTSFDFIAHPAPVDPPARADNARRPALPGADIRPPGAGYGIDPQDFEEEF